MVDDDEPSSSSGTLDELVELGRWAKEKGFGPHKCDTCGKLADYYWNMHWLDSYEDHWPENGFFCSQHVIAEKLATPIEQYLDLENNSTIRLLTDKIRRIFEIKSIAKQRELARDMGVTEISTDSEIVAFCQRAFKAKFRDVIELGEWAKQHGIPCVRSAKGAFEENWAIDWNMFDDALAALPDQFK